MVDVKDIIKSIAVALLIIVLSIPLWNRSQGNMGASIAAFYSNMDVTTDFKGYKSLSKLEDEDYFFVEPIEFNIKNYNGEQKTYSIVYAYDKASKVDYKDVKIMINDDIYNISDINYTEDNLNYYFTLTIDTIDGYENIVKNTRIWLSTGSKASMNDTLNSTLIVR